jgi:predicted AAA+ superfamily ATPase
MFRQPSSALDAWLVRPKRRPLILRGARQVGKTWLVRDLAVRSGRELVELNLERDPRSARHFLSNDPQRILADLSLVMDQDITSERSLLFLDEIQAAGEVIASLRWFAEELPALPVIAAGSLLEFTLANHSFSMPVGRIGYLHVEPLGFREYLIAHEQTRLIARLEGWHPKSTLADSVHERATTWMQRFTMIGGMPAVVAEERAGADARACLALQRDLVATYRDDFAKYTGRMDRRILDTVLHAVAGSIGRKFVYARAGDGVKQHQAKHALELLASAGLCHLVRYSAANGLPLAGETKDTFRKAILLDVGLLHALLGTPAGKTFPEPASLSPAFRAALAEQVAGQELRLLDNATGEGPLLFYWQREGGRPGEIDFLLELIGRIVPIEIKAGAAGAMKSLHQFMFDKKLRVAVRVDENPPSLQRVAVTTTQGDRVSYTLVSLPLYLLWRLPEILGMLDK